MPLTTIIGSKTKRIWAYEQRLRWRKTDFVCECGVVGNHHTITEHQKAKKHGPYRPRSVQSE